MMQQRTIQLLTRYIGMGILFLAGKLGLEVEQAQVEELVLPVVLGLMGIGSFLIDHWLHKRINGRSG